MWKLHLNMSLGSPSETESHYIWKPHKVLQNSHANLMSVCLLAANPWTPSKEETWIHRYVLEHKSCDPRLQGFTSIILVLEKADGRGQV